MGTQTLGKTMKIYGWLTGCALALACAHESEGIVGESERKMQATAPPASQPVDSTAGASPEKGSRIAQTAAIRPFHVEIPEQALVDLRQRIAATRWPERETVK